MDGLGILFDQHNVILLFFAAPVPALQCLARRAGTASFLAVQFFRGEAQARAISLGWVARETTTSTMAPCLVVFFQNTPKTMGQKTPAVKM